MSQTHLLGETSSLLVPAWGERIQAPFIRQSNFSFKIDVYICCEIVQEKVLTTHPDQQGREPWCTAPTAFSPQEKMWPRSSTGLHALSAALRWRARREGALYNVVQEAVLQPRLLVSSFLNGPRAHWKQNRKGPGPGPGPSIYSGLLVFVNPCRSEQSNGRKV